MRVLVVDIGGAHVKILATGHDEPRKSSSGPKMTAGRMVSGVRKLAQGWKYDVVSIGYPGVVLGACVVGGGNVDKLAELPAGCRAGDNANAFLGGFRMWENASRR